MSDKAAPPSWRVAKTERTSVLFVDQSGSLGGAELSLIDIVSRRREGSHVCVLSEGPLLKRLAAAQVSCELLRPNRLISVSRGSSLLDSIGSVRPTLQLVRALALRAKRFDCTYANTLKSFVLLALGQPIHRRRIIFHLRDILETSHFSSSMIKAVTWLSRAVGAHVIANSEATASAFLKAGGTSNVRVIYNGIDPVPFQQIDADEAKSEVVQAAGLDPSRPIIGVFSRLAHWKGQHVFIDALHRLPEVQGVVVGAPLFNEEAYELELREMIVAKGLQDRVRLLGFRDDIPSMISGVDVVTHTSVAPEPFGRVIVEGMLSGKPVIATQAGGASELVDSGRTGLLIAPGDAAALAAAVRQLLSNVDETRKFAKLARDEAMDKYNVDTQVARIFAEIESSTSSHSSSPQA